MKKRLFLIVVLSPLFLGGTWDESFAHKQGQQKTDSLFTVLQIAKADSVKINTLNALADEFKNNNPDTAFYFANEALALSAKTNYKMGVADANLGIGMVFINLGKYENALKSNNIALSAYNQLLLTEEATYKLKILKQKARAYNNIGIIYWHQGNYSEAIKNLFDALKIREEIGDKQGIANSYNNIGIIYTIQRNYPEALKNNIAALKIMEEIGDKHGIGSSYSNIGGIYYEQGNYPEALKNNFASLKIGEEIKDKQGIAYCYGNIGNIYVKQGNYPEALKNYFASLKITEEIGNKEGIAISYNNIGNIYMEQKKNSDAAHYFYEGLLIAKDIRSLDDIKVSYNGLAKLDSAQGNFKQALEHYKMYITARDSMFNEENTKKLVQTQMQYEFDKKESLTKAGQEKKDVIALKEKQKQKLIRNGFVGGFSVVLLFAGVFFMQRNKIKKGKKLSDELLLNILPSEVAEELKQNGSAAAKQFDDVTVMFTDFKNFSQISEKLSPAELVAEIHFCFKEFDTIITRYNIEKIKTIGDSYMCAGGLPVANKTNPSDVVNAGLEIQQFVQEHLTQRMKEGKEPFEIRIGIHTGPVVAGIVGIKKFAYDIWGDTVNIASRMQSSGEASKVNISGLTYELVKHKFSCTHRGKIEAKNKGMIDMYFVNNIL